MPAARIANLGASLILLAALGLALALAGAAGSTKDGRAGTDASASLLDSERTQRGSGSPGLGRQTAPQVSVAPLLAISLERSCPPPGILACRLVIRITTPFDGKVYNRLRTARTALIGALRTATLQRVIAGP